MNKAQKTLFWTLFVFILLAGIFLRFWNLGKASFWVDEVNTFYTATSFNEVGKMLMPSGMVNERAPLYTLITALSLRLFGMDEVATRIPSAVFGLFSILLTYFITIRLFKSRAMGLLSAFLVSFSHFEIGWSRVARMYTLLQTLTLFLIYIFLLGFERDTLLKKPPTHSWILRNGISWVWLLIFAIVLWITFYYVHFLAVFLLAGIGIYLFVLAIINFCFSEKKINKYTIALGIGFFIALVALFISPIRDMVHYYLSYTPSWATKDSSALNRTVLLDFLISAQRFPLAGFFFLGLVSTIVHRHRFSLYLACLFGTPFLLLSLVFTHRVPAYLFFVYPFFLILSAYGLWDWIKMILEKIHGLENRQKEWLSRLVYFLLGALLVISPWLRISLHIPFFPDGMTNMAVTPEEWREASQKVLSLKKENELIITSLPQTALYYGLHSDYCLNWSALEQSKMEHFPQNPQGRWVDMYAGVVCIESLEELISLIQKFSSGWIVISKFHFENTQHTPHPVREFLQTHLKKVFETRQGTVIGFHWGLEEEMLGH